MIFPVKAEQLWDKMETIEEQSKCEISTPPPSPENLRICLVGEVGADAETIEAARTFGVPIITSENGLEIINDYDWRTYYILSEFEGPIFEGIHKNKQCILGPPALKHIAKNNYGLKHKKHYARPIYNYSMEGVKTCFEGIRKKDELTKLVNLIHSMGGGIRKEIENTEVEHLITVRSGGKKYNYAKTFRLNVLRPTWVYDAWEKRNNINFRATTEDFSKEHRLKAFEGQRICFFGFPADEHQHMVDVLKSNGGVPAELDDPECTHVVMPNTGGYFSEAITNTSNSKALETNNPNPSPIKIIEVDIETAAANTAPIDNKENAEYTTPTKDIKVANAMEGDDDDDDREIDAQLVEKLAVDVDYQIEKEYEEDNFLLNDLFAEDNEFDLNAKASTPKKEQSAQIDLTKSADKLEDISLDNPDNLSPILNEQPNLPDMQNNAPATYMITPMRLVDVPMEEDEQFENEEQKDLKRKRDSFDSVSLLSVDSFAMPTSTKKPKLIRTGSITRSIRRSMSFVAHTPIAKMLRPRRSSVAHESAAELQNDTTANVNAADNTFCSITSMDSTFNESICKPVKHKLRNIRQRITRSSSKKDKSMLKTPEKGDYEPQIDDGFKTPKAPAKISISAAVAAAAKASTPKSLKKSLYPSTSSTTTNASFLTSDKTAMVKGAPTTCTDTDINNCTTNCSITNINNNNTNPPMHLTCNLDISNVATNLATTETASNVMQCDTDTASTVLPAQQNTNEMQIDVGQPNTVVDEHTVQTKPEPKNHSTYILKSDWFWYTIQMGFARETDYLFGNYLNSIANTPTTDRRDSLPISFNKRKRKRFSQRIQLEGTPLGTGKRRSSVSDAGLLSVSGSFFDCTTSPDKLESGKLYNESEISTCEQTPIKKSMRFNHFMDFYSTESNYVGILDTIVNLFKNPLEHNAEEEEALLNKSEIRAIFGNFLPIHEVHQSMLERLRAIQCKWSEDCLIGDIILQHRDDLIKAYPPYVNFFEQMKETLQHCDNQNPRFHAFLKINQAKPECGRQTLQDLMIRPVQRLPSISLLLNDILKHTNKNNPDYARLEESLKAIKEVMTHINEDKRKTESRMAIFDIFNDIDGCPAHLVSSNRSFICKCEVTELTDLLSGRGDTLMLYLFSDTIEVCKKRSRGFNSAKSPSATHKSHKHIKLIPLNGIRFVVDITDSPRGFALICRQDKEKTYSFAIADDEIDKIVYLKMLCKQMAEHACRTDTDKALLCRTSQDLQIDLSDVNLSTLSKAFKLAARTRLKVGRAFSFNKTPSKLKRAVSTMMTSPFGSTNSLASPASQMAQMRLASCNNIHEAVDEESASLRSSSPSAQSEVLVVPPLSVQPTRKNKAATSVGRI